MLAVVPATPVTAVEVMTSLLTEAAVTVVATAAEAFPAEAAVTAYGLALAVVKEQPE